MELQGAVLHLRSDWKGTKVTASLCCPPHTWHGAKGCTGTDTAGISTGRNVQRNKHCNKTDLFNTGWRVGRDRWPLVPSVVEPSPAGHLSSMERIYHLPGTSLGCCVYKTIQAGIWLRKMPKSKQKRMDPVQSWKGEHPKWKHIQKRGWGGSLVNPPWWINFCTNAQKRLQACEHLHTWLTSPALLQPNLLWNVF